jgi:hypothetical protein
MVKTEHRYVFDTHTLISAAPLAASNWALARARLSFRILGSIAPLLLGGCSVVGTHDVFSRP